MRSDSVKNVSAYAAQNHAPSLADARLEFFIRTNETVPQIMYNRQSTIPIVRTYENKDELKNEINKSLLN